MCESKRETCWVWKGRRNGHSLFELFLSSALFLGYTLIKWKWYGKSKKKVCWVILSQLPYLLYIWVSEYDMLLQQRLAWSILSSRTCPSYLPSQLEFGCNTPIYVPTRVSIAGHFGISDTLEVTSKIPNNPKPRYVRHYHSLPSIRCGTNNSLACAYSAMCAMLDCLRICAMYQINDDVMVVKSTYRCLYERPSWRAQSSILWIVRKTHIYS